MKYLITTQTGYEVRQDNNPPPGAIVLTDAQYQGLREGTLLYSGGQIVTNPNPPKI